MPRIKKEFLGKPEVPNFLEQRLALYARMKAAAAEQGYDSIAIMHPATFVISGRPGRSLEVLNTRKGWKVRSSP
jgi:hypothetical protein